MMVHGFTSKWWLQQVIEKMSQTSRFALKQSLFFFKHPENQYAFSLDRAEKI